MKKEDHFTLFYRSLMAGLLAGVMATVLNIVFDLFIRYRTGFPLSGFINVASIIFITLFVVLVAGIFYYFIARYLKPAYLVHLVLWLLLTWLCIHIDHSIHRSANPAWTKDFRELLLGIIIITYSIVGVVIPLIVKYDKNIL